MGYSVSMGFKEVLIKVEDGAKALEAIKELTMPWHGETIEKETDFITAMQLWGYEVVNLVNCDDKDDKNKVTALHYGVMGFDGEKWHSEFQTLWETLAPFIQKGAEIFFSGEEDDYWKFVFDGTEMEELAGRIVYE